MTPIVCFVDATPVSTDLFRGRLALMDARGRDGNGTTSSVETQEISSECVELHRTAESRSVRQENCRLLSYCVPLTMVMGFSSPDRK